MRCSSVTNRKKCDSSRRSVRDGFAGKPQHPLRRNGATLRERPSATCEPRDSLFALSAARRCRVKDRHGIGIGAAPARVGSPILQSIEGHMRRNACLGRMRIALFASIMAALSLSTGLHAQAVPTPNFTMAHYPQLVHNV